MYGRHQSILMNKRIDRIVQRRFVKTFFIAEINSCQDLLLLTGLTLSANQSCTCLLIKKVISLVSTDVSLQLSYTSVQSRIQ